MATGLILGIPSIPGIRNQRAWNRSFPAGPGLRPISKTKLCQYRPGGNTRQIADHVKGINYNYTYDKLHQLKTETNTGSYDPISYNYDALGNIMTKSVGSATMDYNYQGPRPHAVKRIRFNGTNYDYTYDANGNTIVGPDFTDPQQVAVRTISYNADNMPRSISHTKGGNTVIMDFVYDGSGNRAQKTVQGGSTTYYIGEHYEVKDGVATKYIFAGNLRVAKIAGTSIHYFHKDHLGSSTVISDKSGNFIETADYTPFGSLRDHAGTNASNYKFTDQEFDPSSGLYNYNARLYDPIIGRFISPDPYVQAPFDPQTLNRYSYVRNNPLIYIDPSGYSWIGKAWKKVKKAAKKISKPVASIAASSVAFLLTGNPMLAGMVGGAVLGGMDGGVKGAVVGAAFGAITGGIGGSDAFNLIAKGVVGLGLGALLSQATSAMADDGGEEKRFGGLTVKNAGVNAFQTGAIDESHSKRSWWDPRNYISVSFSNTFMGEGTTITGGREQKSISPLTVIGTSIDIYIGAQASPRDTVYELGLGLGKHLGIGHYYGRPDQIGNFQIGGIAFHIGIGFGFPVFIAETLSDPNRPFSSFKGKALYWVSDR